MPEITAIVDLRSDTVTRPTPEMRRVIAEAPVGDMVFGDDPSVTALEEAAAALLGKERALFFPSGIMANQAALNVQAPAGTEAVIDALGHIYNYEEAAGAAWSGVQLHPVPTADGLLTAEDAAAAIRPRSLHSVQTSLLCLENTHNAVGGRVLPVERMRAVVEVARERGVRVHLDGARLPNASVASGTPMHAWAELADTVMFDLSKGLGAPIGSVLAGDAETMERAWRVRRRLGGGLHQAGLLAAAGLYGLEHNFDRLADDHARASRLARGVAALPGLSAPAPETNIVMIDLDEGLDPEALLAALAERGVWMTRFGPRRIRAVTHVDVNDAGIERAVQVLAEVAEARAPA
jgi:threonine aldolase